MALRLAKQRHNDAAIVRTNALVRIRSQDRARELDEDVHRLSQRVELRSYELRLIAEEEWADVDAWNLQDALDGDPDDAVQRAWSDRQRLIDLSRRREDAHGSLSRAVDELASVRFYRVQFEKQMRDSRNALADADAEHNAASAAVRDARGAVRGAVARNAASAALGATQRGSLIPIRDLDELVESLKTDDETD